MTRESKICYCGKMFYRDKQNQASWGVKECCSKLCVGRKFELKRTLARSLKRETLYKPFFQWTKPLDKWLYVYKPETTGPIAWT